MSNATKRLILQRWSGFDPYVQRSLINRFLDTYGKDASRDEWLTFLYRELETNRGS